MPTLAPLSDPQPLEQPVIAPEALNGPSQGPHVSPPPAVEGSEQDAPPGSPYTSNRAIIQNLTLPTVPNFDIPPSPPGSPPQKATKKFTQFLDLKKKGQHFNQRLETSSVLRDPGHLRRLYDFAGINEEDQYASTLSPDVAIPTVFPPSAYADELRLSQKRILKDREQQKSRGARETIDFVKSGASSAAGTPSSTGPRSSAAERVMAGVDKERPQNTQKRKDLEHRSRDSSESRSSPKKRR